jgi:hypothetical protein
VEIRNLDIQIPEIFECGLFQLRLANGLTIQTPEYLSERQKTAQTKWRLSMCSPFYQVGIQMVPNSNARAFLKVTVEILD